MRLFKFLISLKLFDEKRKIDDSAFVLDQIVFFNFETNEIFALKYLTWLV